MNQVLMIWCIISKVIVGGKDLNISRISLHFLKNKILQNEARKSMVLRWKF